MTYELALACEGREDRAATFEYAEGIVLVVADGAGGTGYGAEAAAGVIEAVRGHGWSSSPARWIHLLRELDLSGSPGQTAAVVAAAGTDFIAGASVGDCDAWWFGETEVRLTEHQRRKPLVGSGSAVPVGFHVVQTSPGTLVLGSDGLWKYVRREALASALVEPPSIAAQRLIGSVRYPSGALPDDVSVIVCRLPAPSART